MVSLENIDMLHVNKYGKLRGSCDTSVKMTQKKVSRPRLEAGNPCGPRLLKAPRTGPDRRLHIYTCAFVSGSRAGVGRPERRRRA